MATVFMAIVIMANVIMAKLLWQMLLSHRYVIEKMLRYNSVYQRIWWHILQIKHFGAGGCFLRNVGKF